MYPILQKVDSPADIKKLAIDELNLLAVDIREALFNRLTKIGGHCGPNFGSVEAEIALHFVFNSPQDKFVFDVSHQSYAHKMITGRKLGYIDDSKFQEDSGYTNPEESEHDLFNVGHTSTSISLATGLAKARDLAHKKENVIAFIGDGSLSGGEALEALNYAGSELRSNFIVIVNDNEMSIAENHGAIYKNLEILRESNGNAGLNFFKALGFDYLYEPNGNDIQSLIQTFQKVKDIDHPVVVHIHTLKGKGYPFAEKNKEAWHWCAPFDRASGKPTVDWGDGESYESITANYLLEKAQKDPKLLVITPAMPASVGLSPAIRQALGSQYADVGIAEEQAIAMASGAAKRGAKPVIVTNATFLQRTYDQMAQDTAINNNPIAVILNYSSFNTLTDVTHLGIYINSIYGNI
ncbi:MAG: 1-deoxy-D-xylulose-5-phosphate synthase, partial [Hallerella porci]|uniref:1-deoxy-D-xylulose-5-phosphate synthase n=2 Tax=Hallerella TaxID=2815788 RepID=UPI002A8411F6